MNAFIRAVTRSTLNLSPDAEVWGMLDGWRGLIERTYRPLSVLDTAGISGLGGTILGTTRVPELKHDTQMQELVVQNVIDAGFAALFICGGNGSLHAAHRLDTILREREHPCQILFTPASIDNDVANTYGTAIGFYSAIERSMEMMQWIRDTASAHRRVYIIGSMGRKSAFLPFYSGMATGAEYVIRPRERVNYEAIADMIEQRSRDTRIIVSEAYPKSLEAIRAILSEALERRSSRHEIRTVDMGYFQRGGEASVTDVMRANWLGYHMVCSMLADKGSCFFGAFNIGQDPNRISLDDAVAAPATYTDMPRVMIEMAKALR
jgi:6-phosphofructokinase 1